MLTFKKASADHVHTVREQHIKKAAGGDAVVKGAHSPRSWDKENRSARFIMSTETPDRYQDIVVQAGMDLTHFENNPQGLLFHNSRTWPAGTWENVVKITSGRPRRTEGDFKFLPEGVDEDADRAARHVAAGTIKTVSIGFIPDYDEVDYIMNGDDWTGGLRFNKSELIECSLVPIPAQPEALMKDAAGDNMLARSLVEDVLDTWAKTPEGLLIPLKEYEQKFFELSGNRSSIIIDKAFKSAPTFTSSDDLTIKAASQEEARNYEEMSVQIDKTYHENGTFPFDLLGEVRAVGTVISSRIVPEHGEEKDVHVLDVEFVSDAFSGMLRGFKAERYLLAKAAPAATPAAAEGTVPAEGEGAAESKDGAADQTAPLEAANLIVDGEISVSRLDVDGTVIQSGTIEAGTIVSNSSPRVKESSISIEVDTSAARKELDELNQIAKDTDTLLESVLGRLKKFFGGGEPAEKDEKERIEPPLDVPQPASPEEIAEAKQLAQAALKRMVNL